MANTVDFVVVVVIDGKVHTAVPADFTEKQRAAIMHIMYHIGEDPVPPAVCAMAEPMIKAGAEIAAAALEGGSTLMRGAATLSPQSVPSAPSPVQQVAAKTEQDRNHEKAAKTQVARQSGYTGDACTQCGSMQVKRNGSCTVCESCGATTGCS